MFSLHLILDYSLWQSQAELFEQNLLMFRWAAEHGHSTHNVKTEFCCIIGSATNAAIQPMLVAGTHLFVPSSLASD